MGWSASHIVLRQRLVGRFHAARAGITLTIAFHGQRILPGKFEGYSGRHRELVWGPREFQGHRVSGFSHGINHTPMPDKLTKKQRKAAQFRDPKLKQERDELKQEKIKKRALEEEPSETPQAPPQKKRKTRRGKKGKATNGGKGPRFILFVGNLPYDITQDTLLAHFKNSKPDRFRIRQDKGIAFLEFDNDTKEIQSKMELALKMHHLTVGDRKINVELTVGGGGNSENRVAKLKEKNEKMLQERRLKLKQKMEEDAENKKKKQNAAAKPSSDPVTTQMHPSRAALMN